MVLLLAGSGIDWDIGAHNQYKYYPRAPCRERGYVARIWAVEKESLELKRGTKFLFCGIVCLHENHTAKVLSAMKNLKTDFRGLFEWDA